MLVLVGALPLCAAVAAAAAVSVAVAVAATPIESATAAHATDTRSRRSVMNVDLKVPSLLRRPIFRHTQHRAGESDFASAARRVGSRRGDSVGPARAVAMQRVGVSPAARQTRQPARDADEESRCACAQSKNALRPAGQSTTVCADRVSWRSGVCIATPQPITRAMVDQFAPWATFE